MSGTATSERIKVLVITAEAAVKAGELQKAADALRNATQLDPDDASVKQQWAALRQLESGEAVVEVVRRHLISGHEDDGRRALQMLQTKQVSSQDALELTNLLMDTAASTPLLDSLTGRLLSHNISARKGVATRMSKNATEVFELMLERGEESFAALANMLLEEVAWANGKAQATAQKDVFRLCVATLIEAGAEHLERVMRCIARLLSAAPDTMANLIDADVVDAIVSCLDIRQPATLRSQAVLATSKMLEATKQQGEELFSSFITERMSKHTNNDFITVFSAAAAVFPIIPAVAAKLFLTEGFIQQLVPNLERNWEDGAAGGRKSHTLENAALELLSAACVDKACREAIERYCSHWLTNLTQEREGTHKALAALILVKISADSGEAITLQLERMVVDGDPEIDQAIEGLAYTSLQTKAKEEIASNAKLLQQLVKSLKDRPASAFGCLTVLSNLTAYRSAQSEEQKKMAQLKAYANSERLQSEDPHDDDSHVTTRCRKVLEADVIPALVAVCKHATSPTNVGMVVGILLNLAREQRHRPTMTQQGAVRLLLQIRDRIAKTDQAFAQASNIERDASHGLARLLISVNPSHVFTAGLPASSAVSALVPLLSRDRDAEQRNLLPVFEALLALTNLASMEDNSIRDLELRLLWSDLEDHLLFSPNVLVQRASVELICNLMASPNCVAKFVGDGSKREATRVKILLALADVEDFATRRAAGGALAMLTEWDAAVTAILDQHSNNGPLGINTILKMCTDDSDEVKHRGFACLANIVNAPDEVGTRAKEQIKEDDGVRVVQEALKGTKSRDVLAIGVEVLKKIV